MFMEGRVIVGVRSSDQHLAGKFEFPGGKCEPEESPAACAERECLEECGIEVRAMRLFHSEVFSYPDRTVDLSFYLCQPVEMVQQPVLQEPFQWVEQSRLMDLDFPAGNQQVIKLLRQEFKGS